jgi:D-lactate dehydrogenase (cytochrome)
MEREHGKSLDLMRQIKALLDPQGILNPGKIFP